MVPSQERAGGQDGAPRGCPEMSGLKPGPAPEATTKANSLKWEKVFTLLWLFDCENSLKRYGALGRLLLKTLDDDGFQWKWHPACCNAQRSTWAPENPTAGRGDLIWQQQLYLHAFAGVRSRRATIGFWPGLRRMASRSCRGTGILRRAATSSFFAARAALRLC